MRGLGATQVDAKSYFVAAGVAGLLSKVSGLRVDGHEK